MEHNQMSQDDTTTTDEQTAETKQVDGGDQELGENGQKALKAEREARKQADKKATDLQAQIDALNTASLSDLEKAQKAAADAVNEAQAAKQEAMRYRIAAKNGISDEDAQLFLTGATDDAMTAQAVRLVARTPAGPGTPKPDLTQGGHGNPAPGTTGEIFADFISKQLT